MSSVRYPLSLDLRDRTVVVVGGGPVAARRTQALVDAAANVTVVAPYVCEDLAELSAGNRISVVLREYEPGDLDHAWLVHVATGDVHVDERVCADAEARRVFVVRAADATRSTAWVPAVAHLGDAIVAVTAAADPRRARRLRNAITEQCLQTLPPLRRTRPRGRVILVGGGPGDEGLLTVRGRLALAEADVVVVDRLAPRSVLRELDDDVEIVEAGKAPHAHTLTQDQINDVLVDRARRGLVVVRLKGGDPFVLGRGFEEVVACRDAGVPVDVVPGVSSAVAVPALSGIPVTHRGITSAVLVVSGHGPIEWSALVDSRATLVFLMGVARLPEIAERLLEHGARPSTPVAIVESGSTPNERTTVGTLLTLCSIAATGGVRSPAVIVVGDVVALRDRPTA